MDLGAKSTKDGAEAGQQGRVCIPCCRTGKLKSPALAMVRGQPIPVVLYPYCARHHGFVDLGQIMRNMTKHL